MDCGIGLINPSALSVDGDQNDPGPILEQFEYRDEVICVDCAVCACMDNHNLTEAPSGQPITDAIEDGF